MNRDPNMRRGYCGEPVAWSRFLEDWYCGDCRTSDVSETDED